MAFHKSNVFELLYGGAAGGGKSQSLLIESLRFAHIPTYKGIIFRRTYPEIEKSLVPVAYELFAGRAKPKNKGTEWRFDSGATIYLSHLQYEEDKERHKSAEYDYIAFDELTSFSESQYIYLFSRCRGSDDRVQRRIRSATNPTGPGHGWVKDRFLDPDLRHDHVTKYGYQEYEYACGWRDPKNKVHTTFSSLPDDYHLGSAEFSNEKYEIYRDTKSKLDRAFIPALLWGNQILLKSDPDYTKRLMALPDKTQKALLYGSWDLFEGQFFSEWNPDEHVVEPFEIPPNWRRFVAIDYGYAAPFCALWFAVDPDGTIFCYRELYAKKMTTADQSQTILDLTQDEKVEWFTADPSMFSRQGMGESHADVYSRNKLYLIPSSNKRVAGWALMHDYLVRTKLKFFRNCTNTTRTIPTLVHARNNPDDLDTKQEDHAVDAIRYMLLTLKGSVTNISTPDGEVVPEWFRKIQAKKRTIFLRGGM